MNATWEKLGHEAECDLSQNHHNPCISANHRPKLLRKGERSLDCSKTTLRSAGGAFALHESYTRATLGVSVMDLLGGGG
jgi:hypothetical protein